MAVSKVGLGWPVGERDFASLNLWEAAKYTSPDFEEAWCKGSITTGIIIFNRGFSSGLLIRGDVVYTGNNENDLAFSNNRIILAVNTGATAQDLKITEANIGRQAFSLEAANTLGLRIRGLLTNASSGVNVGAFTVNRGGVLRNCVGSVLGANIIALSTTSIGVATVENCLFFSMGGAQGFNRNETSLHTIRNNFTFGSQRDYLVNGANSTINCASGDSTGNITGYTSAELVDFANGDYRIKSTSDLFALGIGAFFEESAGVIPISFNGTIPNISVNVGDVVNIDLSAFFDGTELPFVFTSIGADLSALGLSIAGNAIVGTATLGSLIGARIRGTDAALNTADSNLFNVTVAAVAVNVDSTVSATWPQLTVNANQVSAVPVYTSSASAQWPMLSVQASQSAVAPQYTSGIAATWPMFSAAASQQSAVPQYTLSASAAWPMFAVQSTQQQQLPDGATTVSVTWPLFAVNGSQASTVPEYNATAAAQWPIFAVTVAQEQDLPVGGATVAVTWPMLSVSVIQQSVAPQYSLTVAGTWPMFNVSGLAGEFDYFTAPSARYVIPKLSRRATIPAQARAVTVPSLSRRIAL